MNAKKYLCRFAILFLALFLLIPANISAASQESAQEKATVEQQVTLIKVDSSNTKSVSKTGDNFDSILWIILLLSSTGVCVFLLKRQKIIDK